MNWPLFLLLGVVSNLLESEWSCTDSLLFIFRRIHTVGICTNTYNQLIVILHFFLNLEVKWSFKSRLNQFFQKNICVECRGWKIGRYQPYFLNFNCRIVSLSSRLAENWIWINLATTGTAIYTRVYPVVQWDLFIDFYIKCVLLGAENP